MKTLIVYRSKYGATRKCAGIIAEKLQDDVEMLDIKTNKHIQLKEYQNVIIGGPIYSGLVHKDIRNFCDRYEKELKTKLTAVFVCCFYPGEKADEQLRASFPPWLLAHVSAKGIFGGEIDFGKMGKIDRILIRKIAKIDKNISTIDEKAISDFAAELG